MSIGTEIIHDALRKIGSFSEAVAKQPENDIVGMRTLNSMLELWLSRGIHLEVTPLQAPGDELSEPGDSRNGIVSNLAIRLAPNFDNGGDIVSDDLRKEAAGDFATIKRLYGKIVIPGKVPSSTLIKGAGNRARGFRAETYFRRGEALGGTSTLDFSGSGSGSGGGSAGGITPIVSGGTGASNAPDARANLGLEIGADVQAFNTILANLAAGSLKQPGKDITLNDIAVPTDASADQGGIILKGDTDKTIKWVQGSDVWELLPALQTPFLDATNEFFAPDNGGWDSVGINLAVNSALRSNGVPILDDAAGVMTLRNIDGLDAITRATIEAALQTLANLVSVQGLAVAYADAGEDAIWGWADGGSTYRNLTQGEVQAIVGGAAGNVTTSDTLAATQLLLGNGTTDIVTEADLIYNGSTLSVNSVALANIDDVEVTDINADTSTALTAALADRGQTVTMDNAAPNVFTIPTNGAAAFDIGTKIKVLQIGAGVTTIAADTGVTLNAVSEGRGNISTQFGEVSLLKTAINTWNASGQIGGVGDPSYTFNETAVTGAGLIIYTFLAVDIGAAASDRLVVISGYSTNTDNSGVLSASIGGVSADIVTQVTDIDSTDPCSFILSAEVPAGTTADVVITFGSLQSRCGIASYSLFGLGSTTAVDTNTTVDDAGALDVNTFVNAIVIAVHGEVGANTVTWTGVTEDFGATAIEGSVRFTGASVQTGSSQAPRALNADWSASTFEAGASASWV